MTPPGSSAKRAAGWIGWLVLAAAFIGLSVWLYSVFSKPSQPTTRRTVQEISLLKPPPPPPPPKVTPPPPEQQKLEKIDVPKPQDTPPDQPSQAPPPGPNLGVDAAGSGSGDSFGLVGKPGGNELIGGGGAKADPFAWYSAKVKEKITEAISKDKKLKAASDFQRNVNVWVNASGVITRVELVGQSPSADLDEALRVALRSAGPLTDGAPGAMPQPIRLRVSTRS